jgi:hypothetical protein
LLRYFEGCGRVVIEEPELLMAACTPEYPHWDRIRDWRRHAALFSADLAAKAHASEARPQVPSKLESVVTDG